MLSILETCRISPPPATVGDKSLSLTFFDIIWLLFPPIHQLFFYEFSHSKTHFTDTILPNLKHSLSLTLQHFFPFASNLVVFLNLNDRSGVPRKQEIRHVEGDSVSLTFAESSVLDFDDLVGNHPRDCDKFYPLIPSLPHPAKGSDCIKIPLFSVQVTYFPNSGISIGLTNHHILCDASSRFDFLKAWTLISRSGNVESFLAKGVFPCYDRLIKYPDSLDELFLTQMEAGKTLNEEYQPPPVLVGPTDKVRATFVLTRATTNLFKQQISKQLPKLEYVSSFSVTCAYVWSCLGKSRANIGQKYAEDELEQFICAADCRARLDPPIPQTYFGNCVRPCYAFAKSSLLAGENGFVTAAEVLGGVINKMVNKKDTGVLNDVEKWFEAAFLQAMRTTGVAGTPKLNFYDADFGWGKPKKHETISIDYTGSISLHASKESPEDFEIGLCLPAKQMDAFATIFTSGIREL